MDVKLSVYAKQLPQEARERYIEKIAQISFDDPYLINSILGHFLVQVMGANNFDFLFPIYKCNEFI